MSDLKEVSKAVQESAKLGTTAIKASEKVGSFVSEIIKEPCKELSGILLDKIRYWRWERLVKLHDKAKKILKDRGVTETRAVLPKLAIPLLDNASLESDDKLQSIWAQLLANAMDPNYKENIEYLYIEIIKNLRPLDAKILHSLFTSLESTPGFSGTAVLKEYSVEKRKIIDLLRIESEQYEFAINNLMRLQCLSSMVYNSNIMAGKQPITSHGGTEKIAFTVLGWRFVEACIA